MFAMIYNTEMPTMTDELFVHELDGPTFLSRAELEQYWEYRDLCAAGS